MAVPASERGRSKFQVLLDTRRLTIHTLRITANKNVFWEEYNESIIFDINETAKNIHLDACLANSIRVTDTESCKQRLALQQQAILASIRLVNLIQICRTLFHLPARRVRYWGSLTLTARDELRKWRNGDRKRYREFL